jgi:4'-phosphopantetheinyl transferase
MNDLPAAQPSLRDDETHVWRIDVDPVPIAHWRDLLDRDERSKADRFRFAADRSRYLAAHIALRNILGRYLQIDPVDIQYRTNEYGKPFVADQPVEFSLSHSSDVILIAVTRDRSVGIDVERIRPELDFQPIVDRHFSAREKSELLSMPQSIRYQHFFSLWTRKEAVLKMRGWGLSGLDQAEVSSDNEGKWSVQIVEVCAEYAAALAVGDDSVTIKHFRM